MPHDGAPAGLKIERAVIDWLLAGDVSIQYQTWRDLLHEERPDLQARIAGEGWGAVLLSTRHADGSWGNGFYQPKWTSSHYTLLDLKNLAVAPDQAPILNSVRLITRTEKRADGGIGPGKTLSASDVCVNGMFLNYASYFGEDESDLRSVVDFLIGQQMPDGGFNCRSNRNGARHSSLHSTISVLESIRQYFDSGYTYRGRELEEIARDCIEFILMHRLFKSDRTGAVINKAFLTFPYPWRWRYNILRACDCLASCQVSWDERMQDAVDVLLKKRTTDGRWVTNAAHPGAVHVAMEKAGRPGRWNTLIALRVLAHFGKVQI